MFFGFFEAYTITVNVVRLLQPVDNTECPTLFTALDKLTVTVAEGDVIATVSLTIVVNHDTERRAVSL